MAVIYGLVLHLKLIEIIRNKESNKYLFIYTWDALTNKKNNLSAKCPRGSELGTSSA